MSSCGDFLVVSDILFLSLSYISHRRWETFHCINCHFTQLKLKYLALCMFVVKLRCTYCNLSMMIWSNNIEMFVSSLALTFKYFNSDICNIQKLLERIEKDTKAIQMCFFLFCFVLWYHLHCLQSKAGNKEKNVWRGAQIHFCKFLTGSFLLWQYC